MGVALRPPEGVQYPSFGPIFKPSVVAFAGLAIAVALWGFSYKLSLYHIHYNHHSSIPVAKLWIEHRSAAANAASKLIAKTPPNPHANLIQIPLQQLNLFEGTVLCIPPIGAHGAATSGCRIPFRSPPSSSFSLA